MFLIETFTMFLIVTFTISQLLLYLIIVTFATIVEVTICIGTVQKPSYYVFFPIPMVIITIHSSPCMSVYWSLLVCCASGECWFQEFSFTSLDFYGAHSLVNKRSQTSRLWASWMDRKFKVKISSLVYSRRFAFMNKGEKGSDGRSRWSVTVNETFHHLQRWISSFFFLHSLTLPPINAVSPVMQTKSMVVGPRVNACGWSACFTRGKF